MTLRDLLYALLWLAVAQIAIGLLPVASPYVVDLHAAVGIAVVGLAHVNLAKLRRSGAPIRLTRIARATAALATLQLALGVVLYAAIRLDIAVPGTEWIGFVHAIIALGILAEAASVATAHDMWQKKEFAAAGG